MTNAIAVFRAINAELKSALQKSRQYHAGHPSDFPCGGELNDALAQLQRAFQSYLEQFRAAEKKVRKRRKVGKRVKKAGRLPPYVTF